MPYSFTALKGDCDVFQYTTIWGTMRCNYGATHADVCWSLQALADQYGFRSDNKELVLLLCDNEIEIVAAYVAALQAKQAVMLLNASTNSELLNHIVITYQPKWIVALNELTFDGYRQRGNVLEREQHSGAAIHSELAVLLSTSGTTGSHKFVRLSYANIQSNAEAIAQYLEIDASERGILNLPLSYSYGLSILNSHFHAGAAVLLTGESVVAKTFWNFVREQQATSLPGVPFTYQMLERVGFFKMEPAVSANFNSGWRTSGGTIGASLGRVRQGAEKTIFRHVWPDRSCAAYFLYS